MNIWLFIDRELKCNTLNYNMLEYNVKEYYKRINRINKEFNVQR